MDVIQKTIAEMWSALDLREQRKALKSAYRTVGKKVRDIARAELRAAGFKTHGSEPLENSIYTWVYSKGGGFKVTAKPRRNKGMHKNSRGIIKPIAWFLLGTKERKTKTQTKWFIRTRKGHSTGRIDGNQSRSKWPQRAENKSVAVVENALQTAIYNSVSRALARKGIS